MNQVKYIDLKLKPYKDTWDYQQEIQDRLIMDKTTGAIPGGQPTLIFVEHPHVYTLGKSGKENNLLINPDFLAAINATYYKTDRGGDITYHGPGQLVGYPVFDLDKLGIGIKSYIHLLEESIIQTLSDFGISTTQLSGATGVWIVPPLPAPARKVCAIGVKVSRGITMHGFALNVTTDLEYFNYINPCGFTDKEVTSMAKELGYPPEMEKVKDTLRKHLAAKFGLEIL
jgi:lipoyl(octanoyl) transferase